jgi:hypothetical protein
MGCRSVKACCFVIVATATILYSSNADTSVNARRDEALKGVDACLRRNEISNPECKSLNKNIQTLLDVYRQGDKTVLPTLLHFTYLCDFFGEALIGDPDGFLSAVSHLPETNQEAVANGIAGGIASGQRYQSIRSALMTVSDSSSNYQLARKCLVTLETENALLLVNYFPPQTFANRSGDFLVHWFSRELYALKEKPLWPPTSENERTYRITVLPAFSVPESVTLKVIGDGSGNVNLRATDRYRRLLAVDKAKTISAKQAADFTSLLNRVQFWQLPTESGQLGVDGTEWILEGVQDGTYHVVVRWCPGRTPFGKAGRKLFDLAGYSSTGAC